MNKGIYLGLVHHPVCDKYENTVTTSVTNMDIHDISRSCKTFGISGYFIINPLDSQRIFVERVLKFWETDMAKKYNSDRVEALSLVRFAYTIEDTINQIKKQENDLPLVITTTANEMKDQIAIKDLNPEIFQKPILILFGTGNGLCNEIHLRADIILKPIKGRYKFNHLSVRSAVAIILDRLFSEK